MAPPRHRTRHQVVVARLEPVFLSTASDRGKARRPWLAATVRAQGRRIVSRQAGAICRAQGPARKPVPTESAEICRDKHSCLSLGAINRAPTSPAAGIRYHSWRPLVRNAALGEYRLSRIRIRGPRPLFSPRGEAKCVRGPSVQGARRSASGGVLEQYGEHGEQAQRSHSGPIACFDRQVVRKADEPRGGARLCNSLVVFQTQWPDLGQPLG